MQHNNLRINQGTRHPCKMLERLKQRVVPKVAFWVSGEGAYLSERLQTFKYIHTIYIDQKRAVEDVLTCGSINVTNIVGLPLAVGDTFQDPQVDA